MMTQRRNVKKIMAKSGETIYRFDERTEQRLFKIGYHRHGHQYARSDLNFYVYAEPNNNFSIQISYVMNSRFTRGLKENDNDFYSMILDIKKSYRKVKEALGDYFKTYETEE